MIGTFTTLTDREWIKSYIASLDDNGDQQHSTYVFLKNNRYPDDGFDEELEIYADVCQSIKVDF